MMTVDRTVTATFLENWPAPLTDLSAPHVGRPLSSEDLAALLTQEPVTRARLGCAGRQEFSHELRQWIDGALPRFPSGIFARLGMCSFTTRDRAPQRLTAAWQVMRQLAHPGERAAAMAFRRRFAQEPVWLFLREWRDIPPWSELRLFFRHRQLLGATAVHGGVYAESESTARRTAAVIARAASTIADVLHVPQVVVDIRLTDDDRGFEVVELNPFLPQTGPGLFTWTAGGDFDRTYRYRRQDGESARLPLDPV